MGKLPCLTRARYQKSVSTFLFFSTFLFVLVRQTEAQETAPQEYILKPTSLEENSDFMQMEMQCRDADGKFYFVGGTRFKPLVESYDSTVSANFNNANESFEKANALMTDTGAAAVTTTVGNNKELNADATQVTANIAQANKQQAQLQYKSCVSYLNIAEKNLTKLRQDLAGISNQFRNCAATLTNEFCTGPVPEEGKASIKSQLTLQSNACETYRENFDQMIFENQVATQLSALKKTCSESVIGTSFGDVLAIGVGAAALVGVGVVIGKKSSKKNKNNDQVIVEDPIGTDPGTSGTDGLNRPVAGSTEGCEAGKAKNLNGVCVTLPGVNPGSGSSTEPTSPIVSGNPTSISSGTSGGLTSGPGGQSASGRQLSGIHSGSSGQESISISSSERLTLEKSGKSQNLGSTGGTLSAGIALNSNSPGGDRSAVGRGAETSLSTAQKYRIALLKKEKGKPVIAYLTKSECYKDSRLKKASGGAVKYCDGQIREAQRNLASDLKSKKANLLK